MKPWQENVLKSNTDYLMRILNKKYWPHHVTLGPVKIDQAERWCYENFQSRDWRNVGTYFAFKQEHDAMLFTLRWA